MEMPPLTRISCEPIFLRALRSPDQVWHPPCIQGMLFWTWLSYLIFPDSSKKRIWADISSCVTDPQEDKVSGKPRTLQKNNRSNDKERHACMLPSTVSSIVHVRAKESRTHWEHGRKPRRTLCVEFRERSWQTGEVYEFLRYMQKSVRQKVLPIAGNKRNPIVFWTSAVPKEVVKVVPQSFRR